MSLEKYMIAVGKEAPLLFEVKNITKRFPGVLALNDVSLKIRPGEVHAVLGENGAGKSTLMNIIGGIYQADGGEMQFQGRPFSPKTSAEAEQRGVSIIHQELNLVPELTVAQNIMLGREPMGKTKLFLSESRAARRAKELLDRVGVTISPNTLVKNLSVANQQMIEIAKAFSFDSKLLIMDEPTAALTEREVDNLFKLMHDFISPATAIIYISHRLEELWQVSDHITIFRDGGFVKEVVTQETTRDEVVKLMVGRSIAAHKSSETHRRANTPILEVKNISNGRVHDASFSLYPGEILGFGGLVGAGRTELMRAVVGADPRVQGSVVVNGEECNIREPKDAVDAGLAYLSEDRKQFGLVLNQSVSDNIILPSLARFTRFGFIHDKDARAQSSEFSRKLGVKTPSTSQLVKYLSGGNQQKVVIAKWLARDCNVLIFDEPTRGIDVGAKEEIYGLLNHLAMQGHAVIVISSEMEELLRVSDRILVMCNGFITGELAHDDATQEKIMELATTSHTRRKE
jgi:ribose transport system ATP-binding protein